jgi:hypothetical protein
MNETTMSSNKFNEEGLQYYVICAVCCCSFTCYISGSHSGPLTIRGVMAGS